MIYALTTIASCSHRKRRLNLRFEPLVLEGIMRAFDDTGDGEIDYRKFCELVMGSTQRSASSLAIGQIPGRSNFVSADTGNSDMMVRRKIRVSYKDIRANFRDVSDRAVAISHSELAEILQRYDIDMTEDQFVALLRGCDAACDDGRVKWTKFVDYFRKQVTPTCLVYVSRKRHRVFFCGVDTC
jgi:Ca2+-binding EF-hand superfamily protein